MRRHTSMTMLVSTLMLGAAACGTEFAEDVETAQSALSTSNDLTVQYIQRLPVLNYVRNSANPTVEGWPAAGSTVTWRGFIKNFGNARSNVQYKWSVNGSVVKTATVNIPSNGVASVDFNATWSFTRSTIKLDVDTSGLVAEQEEGNNFVQIASNAISAGVYVEQGTYDFFKNNQRNLTGAKSTCFENWIQRGADRWNLLLSQAATEPAGGVKDRIRIDKITIVPTGALPLAGGLATNNPNMNDMTVDLQWGFPASSYASYSDTTTVSVSNPFYYDEALFHELGHARYLIDNYGFNVHANPNCAGGRDIISPIERGACIVGTPYLPMVSSDTVYYTHQTGLMQGDYTFVDKYSAQALNLITGRRALDGNMNAPANLGVYLNDLPSQNRIKFVDKATGAALVGASIRIYQSSGNPDNGIYGKRFDATPDITATTNSSGQITLGRNPFSVDPLSPWHENTVVLVRVMDTQQRVRYVFMEASDFNLEKWRGKTTGDYVVTVEFLPGAIQ